ncbi:MAG: hypothetical protein KDJ22_13395 [Candidatus Competibacteraceae bacterium]|nr:hypothetical protein [Candidatus Competibacteraceae bacterium]
MRAAGCKTGPVGYAAEEGIAPSLARPFSDHGLMQAPVVTGRKRLEQVDDRLQLIVGFRQTVAALQALNHRF